MKSEDDRGGIYTPSVGSIKVSAFCSPEGEIKYSSVKSEIGEAYRLVSSARNEENSSDCDSLLTILGIISGIFDLLRQQGKIK